MYSTQAYQQRLGPVGEHVATYEELRSQRYVQLFRIPTASKFCQDRFRRSHRAHSNVQQLILINSMTHDHTTCWNPVKFPMMSLWLNTSSDTFIVILISTTGR